MRYLVSNLKDRWGNYVEITLISNGAGVGQVWGYHNTYENYMDFHCVSDLIALASRNPRVWEGTAMRIAEVDHSSLNASLRGKGLGVQMYLRYAREHWDLNGGKPFIFIPQSCNNEEGSTSDMALRVWRSLARKYPSSGECILISKRP
jgi:hypothetical protein